MHGMLFGFCLPWSNESMKHKPPKQAFGPTINRLADVMAHTNRYAFRGVSRLALDARVSPSSISRLINGKMNPSFVMVARVTTALESTLGYRIDPRDLVAEMGSFLTKNCCDLTGCQGCLPDAATDEFGDLRVEFIGVRPGRWVTSEFPNGYTKPRKGGNS